MSTAEYETWRDFIRKRSGLYFPENRTRALCQRLWERMRLRGNATYGGYYRFVAFDPAGEEEWPALVGLLLNNETSFFRHAPSFDALSRAVLPELAESKSRLGESVVRFWSAGCSTGEEAYSMAMAAFEALDRRVWQVCVSGSDISDRALERARLGRYKLRRTTQIPKPCLQKYMTPAQDGRESTFQVSDALRASVQFLHLNLSQPGGYPIEPQDVIFCQNVLIYFTPEDRISVVERLCERLGPGGYLFLGPAEVVGLKLPGIQARFLKDMILYQKALNT